MVQGKTFEETLKQLKAAHKQKQQDTPQPVQQATPKWVTMGEACAAVHLNRPKMYRLLKKHGVTSRPNPRDERQRFVDLNDIKAVLGE